jgi:hypothetical protein
VAVLAIEVTWPDMTEADALRYEPWTRPAAGSRPWPRK